MFAKCVKVSTDVNFPSEQLTQKTPKICATCLFDQQLAQGGDENSANMFTEVTAFVSLLVVTFILKRLFDWI